MAPSRTILIAGAGIGGLTAALTIANAGFRVVVLEQAARLEETGAGLQLGPNATRLLVDLGLRERLEPVAVAPSAIRIRHARTGADRAVLPLATMAARLGAPFWTLHRADLQAVLVEAANRHPDIEIKLNCRVEDFAVHANGITVEARQGHDTVDERGVALIGADGLWSAIRTRLGPILNHRVTPQFAQRTAYRALVPADAVADELRGPQVQLWLGQGAHLVHYPVRGGALINIVAIVHDDWQEPGWTAPGAADDVLARFPTGAWGRQAHAVLEAATHWQKWALYDTPPLRRWGHGPVTLLGDAAHPMLPFLAQGAAMSIEDATVLAERLRRTPDDLETAFRAYEKARAVRTARAQHEARRNGGIYQMAGVSAFARNAAMRLMGGRRLLAGYDWLYGWRPS